MKQTLSTFLFFVVTLFAALTIAVPAQAIPSYSLRYQVPCSTCHTVPPRLNTFGLAFQANFFNWPGGAPDRAKGLKGIPVSVIATPSVESGQGVATNGKLRTVELYPSDGFTLGNSERGGGYFVDLHASFEKGGGDTGDLEDAYVALPIAGRRGQLALTVGQATPLLFQADPINYVADTPPLPLDTAAGNLAFDAPVSVARLDYFARRGTGTANGNYVSVGLPFSGTLALNRNAHIGDSDGVFAHVFHREGYATGGLIGYTHGSDHLAGLIGTYAIGSQVFFTLTGSEGHDENGQTRQLSVESEYDFKSALAVVGRLEMGNFGQAYPVAAVTYYPGNQKIVRLSAETTQQKGVRTFFAASRVQF